MPTVYLVTHLASQIYRNYDGNRGTFGETSVQASVDNPDNLSAFAALRAVDGALTVMVVNKQQGSTPVTVNLGDFAAGTAAEAWQINSPAQTAISRLADVRVSNRAVLTTVPSQSITLLVIPAGNGMITPLSGHPDNSLHAGNPGHIPAVERRLCHRQQVFFGGWWRFGQSVVPRRARRS